MPFFRLGKPKNPRKPTPIASTPVVPTPVVVTLSPLSSISLTVGTPFTRTFSASGGAAPYSFAVAAGTLPAGLALGGAVLSGTPTTEAAFSFGIQATDANSIASTVRTFSGTVAAEAEAPTGFDGPFVAPIGAGGYAANIDQSSDGLRMVHSPDVANGMIRDSGEAQWRWFLNPDSLLLEEHEPRPSGLGEAPACSGLRIAPSNKDVIYAQWNSLVFKSEDGGETVRRTGMGQQYIISNGVDSRLSNSSIAIHPTDPDIALFGTCYTADYASASGPFYTLDGGDTPVKITGVGLPANTSGGQVDRYLVGSDPGDASRWYIFTPGVGLHVSTDGVDGPYSLIAGSPLRCSHLSILADGTVFLAAGNASVSNDIYKRTRAGTATSYTSGLQSGAITVAVDPNNANFIIAAQGNGHFSISFNGGSTWNDYKDTNGNVRRGAGDIEWLSSTPDAPTQLYPAQLMFDKAVSGKLWLAHGTGVSYCTIPANSGQSLIWLISSRGNEEKVGHSFLSIPGKPSPILGNWDYMAWKMDSLTEWTNQPFQPPLTGSPTGLAIASDMDFASDDANFAVMAVASPQTAVTNSNAYTTDAGETWQSLPNQAGFTEGGMIACNTKQQIIILETWGNGKGWWTADGGESWAKIQLDPGTDTDYFHAFAYLNRHVLSADKTTPGRFSLVYTNILRGGSGFGNALAGLWTTEDCGESWTRTITGVIGASLPNDPGNLSQFYQAKLEYVPGFAGEMLYTPGVEHESNRLYLLTENGGEVAAIREGNITQVNSFDFGPIAPGQTRPSVAFYGKVDGVWGLYLSLDWFATEPALVSRFPVPNLGYVSVVGCDRNVLGRIFVGTGAGWTYFEPTT